MVEPGPVNTEFEMKLMEEVARSEFPGADPATVRYFKEIYLPASHEIFSTMGQTPESVSTVGHTYTSGAREAEIKSLNTPNPYLTSLARAVICRQDTEEN